MVNRIDIFHYEHLQKNRIEYLLMFFVITNPIVLKISFRLIANL